MPGEPELMTADEHEAMDLTCRLYNLLCGSVIGRGPSRQGDATELAQHIHNIQNMVLAQAAARAYPQYRLLGDERPPPRLTLFGHPVDKATAEAYKADPNGWTAAHGDLVEQWIAEHEAQFSEKWVDGKLVPKWTLP